MRIFVDENIPSVTVEELIRIGHDVRDIRGTVDQGMADDKLWALAQVERRLVVTTEQAIRATAGTNSPRYSGGAITSAQ